MGLKELLKPNKSKILTLFLLILTLLGISIIGTVLSFYVGEGLSLLFWPIAVFTATASYFTLFILATAYLFACYITENKTSLKKGAVLYAACMLIISYPVVLAIDGYNNAFGSYCKIDSDCRLFYSSGSYNTYNNFYINLLKSSDFKIIEEIGRITPKIIVVEYSAICENNQCKTRKTETFNLYACEAEKQKFKYKCEELCKSNKKEQEFCETHYGMYWSSKETEWNCDEKINSMVQLEFREEFGNENAEFYMDVCENRIYCFMVVNCQNLDAKGCREALCQRNTQLYRGDTGKASEIVAKGVQTGEKENVGCTLPDDIASNWYLRYGFATEKRGREYIVGDICS